jgi:hypothetical protein
VGITVYIVGITVKEANLALCIIISSSNRVFMPVKEDGMLHSFDQAIAIARFCYIKRRRIFDPPG